MNPTIEALERVKFRARQEIQRLKPAAEDAGARATIAAAGGDSSLSIILTEYDKLTGMIDGLQAMVNYLEVEINFENESTI